MYSHDLRHLVQLEQAYRVLAVTTITRHLACLVQFHTNFFSPTALRSSAATPSIHLSLWDGHVVVYTYSKAAFRGSFSPLLRTWPHR